MKKLMIIVMALAMMALPVFATNVSDGLVGYWKLNETTGDTAYDISGNGLNGTYIGAITHTNDSAQWDENTAEVFVPYNELLNISEDVSVTGWLYYNGTGDYVWIASRGWMDEFEFYVTSAGVYRSSIFGSECSGTLPTGEWIFVSMTQNATDTSYGTKFYSNNGSSVCTATSGNRTPTETNLSIGNRAVNDGDSSIYAPVGTMQRNVRIYNRVLTAEEIQQIYAEELPPEPIVYYVNWTLSPANESTGVSTTFRFDFGADTNYNTSRYRMIESRGYLFDENGTNIAQRGMGAQYFPFSTWINFGDWDWYITPPSHLNYEQTYSVQASGYLYDQIDDIVGSQYLSEKSYFTTASETPTDPVITLTGVSNYSIHQVRATYNVDVNTVRTADINCKDESDVVISGVSGDTVTTGGYTFICIFADAGNFAYNTTYQWYVTYDDTNDFHVNTTKYDEYTTQTAPVPVITDLGGTPALPYTAYSYNVEAGDTGSMTVTFLDSSDNVINGYGGTPCVFTGAVSIGNNTFTCNVPTTEDLSYSLYINVTDVYGNHVESTHYSTFTAPQSVTGQVTAMTNGFVEAILALFVAGMLFLILKMATQ